MPAKSMAPSSRIFWIVVLGAAVGLIYVTGCMSMLFQFPKQAEPHERFKALSSKPAPVQDTLMIRWNRHAVPYVIANNESDTAFGIGVVHAHLRLGQIEIFRILSQGRVAESIGPLPYTRALDDGVRIFGLRQAAEKTLSMLDPSQQSWLQSYVDGINWVIQGLEEKPFEHRFLDIPLRPFSVLDILTLSKLMSADLSWGTYIQYLDKMKNGKNWESQWARLLEQGEASLASVHNPPDEGLTRLIELMTRSGSNSLVLDKSKSSTGSALMANDPHVGLFLPNFWLIAGVHSPKQQVVGLMIPGMPFFGIGRNPHFAWGGTNMRGISSHLFDVSDLPDSALESHQETVVQRYWFDRELRFRKTSLGPVLTDWSYLQGGRSLPKLALWWAGANGSNEIAAFVDASKAKNWAEFLKAFQNYQVSAMNIVYADAQGNIGMLPAYAVPILKDPSQTLKLIKPSSTPVQAILPVHDQPNEYNPSKGFIASANNKPFENTAVPYAYAYAGSDRIQRLTTLASQRSKWTVQDLKELQKDTFLASAFEIKELVVGTIGSADFGGLSEHYKRFAKWDGHYNRDNAQAPAFEILMYYAWQDYLVEAVTDLDLKDELRQTERWRPLLKPWLASMDQVSMRRHMTSWLERGKASLERHPDWGSFHRQKLAHPFGGIPFIGRRFLKMVYGEGGSNDTLFKSGRRFSSDKSDITYGASARHISDMSDLNANHFVLKGGQDGWLDNKSLTDQVALWDRGDYIQVPLERDLIEKQFTEHVTVLEPLAPRP